MRHIVERIPVTVVPLPVSLQNKYKNFRYISNLMRKLTHIQCAELIQKHGQTLSTPIVDVENESVDERRAVTVYAAKLKEPVIIPQFSPSVKNTGETGDYLVFQPVGKYYFVLDKDQAKENFPNLR